MPVVPMHRTAQRPAPQGETLPKVAPTFVAMAAAQMVSDRAAAIPTYTTPRATTPNSYAQTNKEINSWVKSQNLKKGDHFQIKDPHSAQGTDQSGEYEFLPNEYDKGYFRRISDPSIPTS